MSAARRAAVGALAAALAVLVVRYTPRSTSLRRPADRATASAAAPRGRDAAPLVVPPEPAPVRPPVPPLRPPSVSRVFRVPAAPPPAARPAVPPASARQLAYSSQPVSVGRVSAVAERASAVAAVRLHPAPVETLGSNVAVHPPAGTRARVIPTSNPAVTVVWLYDRAVAPNRDPLP